MVGSYYLDEKLRSELGSTDCADNLFAFFLSAVVGEWTDEGSQFSYRPPESVIPGVQGVLPLFRNAIRDWGQDAPAKEKVFQAKLDAIESLHASLSCADYESFWEQFDKFLAGRDRDAVTRFAKAAAATIVSRTGSFLSEVTEKKLEEWLNVSRKPFLRFIIDRKIAGILSPPLTIRAIVL